MSNYNDGSLPFGGIELTIAANAYWAENFTTDEPSNTIEILGAEDAPKAQISTSGFVTGTATLQSIDANTKPALFDEFTAEGTDWYIDNVGKTRSNGDIYKFSISFRKVINAAV